MKQEWSKLLRDWRFRSVGYDASTRQTRGVEKICFAV